MTQPASSESIFSRIPGSVVLKAQEDTDFALSLLDEGTRFAALAELGLSEEQLAELYPILDEIAALSFHDAIQRLRAEGGVSIK